MRTRFLVTALAVMLGAGLFVAAPTHEASASSGVHCLQYGQTLSGVAAMYGVSTYALAQYNGIANPNYVRAGTCLSIPPYGWGAYHAGYKPVPHGGYYKPAPYHHKPVPYYGGYGYAGHGYHCVRFGETLSSIGAQYGVSAWSIAYANGIANPNYIRAGTWLRIP